LIARIDEKKLEELGRFLDNISVANDLLEKLRELELSGALDAGLNMGDTSRVDLQACLARRPSRSWEKWLPTLWN
jgi:hypothetical protein